MSSVRLLERKSPMEDLWESPDDGTQWVDLASPTAADSRGDVTPVLEAIAAVRSRLLSGEPAPSATFTDDEIEDLGGGDAQLIQDISEEVARRWDA